MDAINEGHSRASAAGLNIIRYGRPGPLPERLELAAGPLTAVFAAGDLWNIRLGGCEIASRIYLAARDRDWGVVPVEISNLETAIRRDGFAISYDARSRRGEIDFSWRARILGAAGGSLVFEFDGEALSGFWNNRIGLCVHHTAAECAGTPCQIEDAAGWSVAGGFPVLVAPHQPFQNLQSLQYVTREGCAVRLRFRGDIFETEDQRNWTDASYKTYSTPLSAPYPRWIEKEARVRQSVTIAAQGDHSALRESQAAAEVPVIPPTAVFVHAPPKIGLGAASHGGTLSVRELERLRALCLGHLRFDLHWGDGDWRETLERAVRESHALGVGLEIAVFLPAASERALDELTLAVQCLRPNVVRWIVFEDGRFVASDTVVQRLGEAMRPWTPDAAVGGGSDANFAELNRNRPDARSWDFVSFAANPQVHAFDNESVMETCTVLPDLRKTVQNFAPGVPAVISPATLKPRFNAVATSGASERTEDELPENVDPRQMSLFAAAWTAAFFASACAAQIESVTLFETTGWRGVMEIEAGVLIPEHFPSIPGALFPVYHVLQALGEYAGADALAAALPVPRGLAALRLRRGASERLLIANLTAEVRQARIAGAENAEAWLLDETTARDDRSPAPYRETLARDGRVTLRRYAVAWIDCNDREAGSAL
ncbi:hypothetical protein CCAX7_25380 [Capsulimonas corticalis]|uniref:Uncharacterized protein n=2 Tax=Capsulimonas corticalis TaxID=2219043 RepID=A0A402CVP1_9BACT|nr:hypothetical protein CCAX7_25380 [Capsulimonas corticalis]